MTRSARAIVLALAVCTLVVPQAAGDAVTRDVVGTHTVFLDPGHGGTDTGAVYVNTPGMGNLSEKDVNLAVALKTAELLKARGYRVILSREMDSRPQSAKDINGDGRLNHRDGLQATVDLANRHAADLFISMHSNSSRNSTASGLEVYYCSDREFARENRRLAALLQSHLARTLADTGYGAVLRGVKDDTVLYRRRGHLFVLGPVRTGGRWRVHPRATEMPGALAEALFVSNGAEARLLASEAGQWALARGYAAAVDAYFEAG